MNVFKDLKITLPETIGEFMDAPMPNNAARTNATAYSSARGLHSNNVIQADIWAIKPMFKSNKPLQ